jgi:RimJ/RimL family protein N-acetyltransferase
MIVTLAVQPTGSAPALVLRPWTRVDLPALVAAHTDPAMRRFLARPVVDEADAEMFLAAQEQGWADGTRFSFAVFEAVDEVDLVGMVAVKRADAASRVAEVGYWTVAKARGRGIAPRSVEAVTGWSLGEGGVVDGLDLLHAVDNEASCRVAQKCGFSLAEVLPAQPPAYPETGHRHRRDR